MSDELDSHGMTALMYAARYNNNPGVINALLDAGADSAWKSLEGKTAFEYHELKLKEVDAGNGPVSRRIPRAGAPGKAATRPD